VSRNDPPCLAAPGRAAAAGSGPAVAGGGPSGL